MIYKNFFLKIAIVVFVALIFGYDDLKHGKYFEFIARTIFIFAFAQAMAIFTQSQK